MKRISLFAAVISVLALAGCSSRPDELARVGNTVITRADFDEAARRSGAPYAALGDTGRALLLEDLIKRQLMIEAAKQEGLYRDSSFLVYIGNIRDQVVRQRLLESLTPEVQVSEAEARAFYDRQETEARLRVILTSERAGAEAALGELNRGLDFVLVAARFNTPGQVPAGGDIGWVQAGTLVRALDPVVTDTPIGKVVGPVEQPYVGWFLARVDERRKAERPPYEQLRDRMVEAVRQRKRSALAQRAAQRISSAYRVRVNAEGAAFMAERLKPDTQQLLQNPTPADPNLSEAEKAIELGTWSGGVYTLGDAWDAISKRGVQGPNLYVLPQVVRWIEGQMFERALLAEANRRHLAEDPEPARMIRDRENNFLVESFYNRNVGQHVVVTEADLREEYQLQAAQMQGLQSADVLMAVVPDSARALAVLDHTGQGGGLEAAVAAAQANTQVSPFTVTYPSQSPVWQTLQPRLAIMRPGETTGPFQVPGGWLLIQMVRAERGAQTFENLDPGLLNQLRNSAQERRREAVFIALTDSLRRKFPVTIHRDRLARIPWPPPSVSPSFGSGG